MSDAITDEIRESRRILAAQFGNDLDLILADIRRREAADQRKYVSLSPRLPLQKRDEKLMEAQSYHAAIRDILLHAWDPIGVIEISEAQDEYDSYIGDIYALIVRREPYHKIVDFLWWAETKNMGLFGNRARTERVAQKLAELPNQLAGSV